jgi:flagellar hook-associated protein 1 FlgK
MSLLSALSSGASALFSASTGLEVTSHNIANANTPGYTARSVLLSPADPLMRGTVSIGQGVDVMGVLRPTDGLLGVRTMATAGISSAASTLHQQLSSVEHWFDESMTAGPSLSLAGFFDALGSATLDPSDPTARTEVLHAASSLASTITDTSSGLSGSLAAISTSLEESVPAINAVLQEVADLNERIVLAGGSLTAGDLADQRDLLLRQLSEELGTTVSYGQDGVANVYLGGHALVESGEARELEARIDDDGRAVIDLSVSGQATIDVTENLGGRLGGLSDSWHTIGSYIDDLDSFVVAFATALNDTHAAGFDANGQPGGALFTWDPTDPSASFRVDDTLTGDPNLLAFATDPMGTAGDAGNLQALMDLENADIVDGKKPGEFLSGLTNRVGTDVASAASTSDRHYASLADLDSLGQTLRGVNLDQEAVHLMEWQTAYQAAAKVLEVVDEALGILMELP